MIRILLIDIGRWGREPFARAQVDADRTFCRRSSRATAEFGGYSRKSSQHGCTLTFPKDRRCGGRHAGAGALRSVPRIARDGKRCVRGKTDHVGFERSKRADGARREARIDFAGWPYFPVLPPCVITMSRSTIHGPSTISGLPGAAL